MRCLLARLIGALVKVLSAMLLAKLWENCKLRGAHSIHFVCTLANLVANLRHHRSNAIAARTVGLNLYAWLYDGRTAIDVEAFAFLCNVELVHIRGIHSRELGGKSSVLCARQYGAMADWALTIIAPFFAVLRRAPSNSLLCSRYHVRHLEPFIVFFRAGCRRVNFWRRRWLRRGST